MREFGNYPAGIIPQVLLERATREIETYTVSLILDQRLTGSGTLVTVERARGILTAHHVSKLVCRDQDELLGINIANHAHGFFVPVSDLRHHVIGESKEEDGKPLGPDLAFLEILDPKKLATIATRRSFFRVSQECYGGSSKFLSRAFPGGVLVVLMRFWSILGRWERLSPSLR